VVDNQAHIITRVTAKLPLLKTNQTIQLPLVSASSDLVYYLDGDTEIHSLSPRGATALVKTIAAGSSSVLAFAVSTDDQRIAVSLITQKSDHSKDAGHGYVENLADGGNHLDLFSNTAADAIRWPAGWHGNEIVDGAGYQCGGYYGPANAVANDNGCPASYHVINAATGSRAATVCESPLTQPPNENVNDNVTGLPVSGGVACVKSEYYFNGVSTPPSAKIAAIDWTGRETTFLNGDSHGQLLYGNCTLAPGGLQMACTEDSTAALTFLAPGASPNNLGRRYNVLGWVDASHLVVDIDSNTLGVLASDTGNVTTLAVTNADKVGMTGTMPGAL
jgi:hypothetical protein